MHTQAVVRPSTRLVLQRTALCIACGWIDRIVYASLGLPRVPLFLVAYERTSLLYSISFISEYLKYSLAIPTFLDPEYLYFWPLSVSSSFYLFLLFLSILVYFS